jgi:hypothetical protein
MVKTEARNDGNRIAAYSSASSGRKKRILYLKAFFASASLFSIYWMEMSAFFNFEFQEIEVCFSRKEFSKRT